MSIKLISAGGGSVTLTAPNITNDVQLALPTSGIVTTEATQTLSNKTIAFGSNTLTGVQPTLVSGTNIKTINGTTILGSGDITIVSGTGDVTLSGTQTLTNKTIAFASNTLTDVASTNTSQTLTNKTIAFASNTLTGVAPLASPTFTGVPAAPTAAVGTNTTQLATTAHVFAERSSTATLTNKTINLTSNTLSATLAQLNTAISDATVVSTTSTVTLTNKTLGNYTETVFTITDGTTVNLNPNNGPIQTWTLGANRTPGQISWAAGQSITLLIDDGTACTITWSTLAVVWKTDGGVAPTLNLTGFTVIVLWKVGTTIYGARVGDA